jgi:ABC-2 type transport system permease protein
LAKYLKVFEIGLQNTFVYRWNFLLRSVLGMVPLLGMFYLWGSIFEARGTQISGYDQSGMLFYFLITILIDNWVAPTEDEWQIAAEIREGQMSALLTKPLHYLSYRLSLYSGHRLLYAAVTAAPLGLLCYFMRADVRLPASGLTCWENRLCQKGLYHRLSFQCHLSPAQTVRTCHPKRQCGANRGRQDS